MKVRVAIIGAGTAGLSARREVAKVTDDYIVIDDGPMGTTCARVGCMPSKVLIQVANDFHRRHKLAQEGIDGGDGLTLDIPAALAHVRSLRDRFVRAVRKDMESWEANLVRKRARIVGPNTIDLEGEKVEAERIIIATGSSPIVPAPWKKVSHRLIDTDAFFEKETLPKRVAVIGLGVIGLELGQALSRLGIEVEAITLDNAFGGMTDPALQDVALDAFKSEFPVHLSGVDSMEEVDDTLAITLQDGTVLRTDAALVTVGRKPNLSGLGIAELDVEMSDRGIPAFDANTFRVKNQPWYIAGDVNGARPLLHETSDEGRIAGHNAVHDGDQCFKRRTALTITFSEPNIALVGASHRQLTDAGEDFVVGRVSYEGQGRAIVKLAEKGALHVYASRKTGALLGAELFAPDGEHLAHLLSWALATNLTIRQMLSLPFYHPVIEEGLRTALRDAARQIQGDTPALEVLRCADPPVGVIA